MHQSIGFIDYYLDEWHANHYPEWLRQASEGSITVDFAYGAIDSPLGGRSTESWCHDMGIRQCKTIDELVEKSDYIIVLSPDNPEQHWALCQQPLRSGKRVYVDKTFAPTAQIARDLFSLAQAHQTPVCSSSALRFAKEYEELLSISVKTVVTAGPGQVENYLIHQIEPMVAMLQEKPVQVLYTGSGQTDSFAVMLENGKMGYAHMLGGDAFSAVVQSAEGKVQVISQTTEMFERLMQAMLRFFRDGYPAAPQWETIAIAEILEAAGKAMQHPGEWIRITE